jgi:hypothetical protein
MQNKEQKLRGGICEGSSETNPRLIWMGPPISRISQNPSPEPAHIRTLEPVESSFNQDFDHFMNGLDNSEPFDDIEDWSDNVDLFINVWPIHPNTLMLFGNWPNLRWEKPKLQNNPVSQLSTNPGLRSLNG